jgi:hypothetical protein
VTRVYAITRYGGHNPKGRRQLLTLAGPTILVLARPVVRRKERGGELLTDAVRRHLHVPPTEDHGPIEVRAPGVYRSNVGVLGLSPIVLDLDHDDDEEEASSTPSPRRRGAQVRPHAHARRWLTIAIGSGFLE